jgi:small GTP-binding protein
VPSACLSQYILLSAIYYRDINGRDEYRSVLVKYNYLKGAAGFLVVFDVTNRESFDNLKSWLALIHQCTSKNVVIVVAANKCDLVDQVQVSEEEEMKFVEEYGYDLVHTSAKLGTNVTEAFALLVQKVYDQLKGINS